MAKVRAPARIVLAKPVVAAKFKDHNRFGVEIEIEGNILPRNNRFCVESMSKGGYMWTTHEDGSLRGESCEYVFAKATPLKDSLELIDNLFAQFKLNGSRLTPSNRTSAHVHVNMSGLKINQINAFVVLWFMFEEAVINTCGELRKNNHFCLSAKESSAVPNAWYRSLATGNYKFSNEFKYAAINFASLGRFGTLEFRCFPMPTQAEDIKKWVKFLSGLKEVALEKYADDVSIVARDLSERGPVDILSDICRVGDCPDLVNEICRVNPNLRSLCLEGFRNIQEAVYDYDWSELKDRFNSTYVENPFGEQAAPVPVEEPIRRARPRARNIEDVARMGPPPPVVDWEFEMHRIQERAERAVRQAANNREIF